jgi:hypothetical protein
MTRSPLIVAAVGAALALGACGGSDDGGGGSASSAEGKAFEGALKYARCMREHGIDMPDPKKDANGRFRVTAKAAAGSGADNAKMQAAQKDCQKYMKAGGGKAPSAAEQAKAKDAMLAYTRCMRSQGVKIADPQFTSGGGILNRAGGPGQTNPDSPAFKAADKVCKPKLAAIEKGGGPSSGTEAKP